MVFCEGEASEPDYLNGIKRLESVRANTAVLIEIDPNHGVPLTLVRRAVERLESDSEVDECWCVFDVEAPLEKRHPNLQKAVSIATAKGIRLAISNPCFELWLILHHAPQTRYLTTSEAESRSRRLDGRAGKRIDAGAYVPKRATAVQRAKALARMHETGLCEFPEDNPSSGVHRLLAAIDPSAS